MSISYPVHPTCPRNKNIYQSQNKLRSLDKDEQQAFWQKLKEAKGAKGLTKVIEEVATRNHFEQSVSVGKKEYKPLGVWANEGILLTKLRPRTTFEKTPCSEQSTVLCSGPLSAKKATATNGTARSAVLRLRPVAMAANP